MTRKNAVQHGTPQGYKKHVMGDWGEPCDACKEAHNQEIADYRQRRGRDRTQENNRRTARARALTRLSLEYPDRTHELINEELKNLEESR
jgi:hypothetical protein